MKILHIIPSLGIGGTEKMVFEICGALKPPAFQHKVIALKFGGQTSLRLKELGVEVQILNSPNGFLSGLLDSPRLFFCLKGSIKEYSPDIVHTWLSRANTIGRMASAAAGILKVVSSLRVMEVEKSYHLWAEARTARWAKVVTVNCSALKDFAVHKIGIPENKIVQIPNGIDLSRLNLDPSLVDSYKTRWVKPGEFVIGTMGRLHRQKGIDIFLKSAQKVLKEIPNARFLIAGNGPEYANLNSLAAELGIKENVTFCSWVSKSLEFISVCDVFVLASRWEGMPNVLLEAMSLKKPIVATRVGGAPDLIASESEGVLIPAEDIDASVENILRVAQNASLREQFGQNAFLKAQKKFSLQKMAEAYRNLYETL